MKKPLITLLFLLMCSQVWGATRWVRTDGGTGSRCTGLADAIDPGSGTDQACAVNHPQWIFPPATGNSTARAAASGDTVIIKSGSYRIGCQNSSNCLNSTFNQGNGNDCYIQNPTACGMAAVPSNVTVIGCSATGCTTEAERPELWGAGRVSYIFKVDGKTGVTLQDLEITDHANCAEAHPTLSCGGADAAELSMYDGIRAIGVTSLTLDGVYVHGAYRYGIYGQINGLAFTDSKLDFNGRGGWGADTCNNSTNCPNTGNITFTGSTPVTSTSSKCSVSWNGCVEDWQNDGTPVSQGCYAGSNADAIGTAATRGTWSFTQCDLSHNTSDGPDLLYLNDKGLTGGSMTFKRSRIEGNVGNPIKGPPEMTLEDNLIIANCGFFSGKSYTYPGFSHCRAGATAISIAWRNSSSTNPTIYNNTIVSGGAGLIELEKFGSSCTSGIDIPLRNNILLGGRNFNSPSNSAFFWYNSATESANNCHPELLMQDNICTGDISAPNCTVTDTSNQRKQTAVSGNVYVATPTNEFTGTISQGPSTFYTGTDYMDQLFIKVGASARNIANTGIGDDKDFNNFDRDAADSLWDAGGFEYGTEAQPGGEADCQATTISNCDLVLTTSGSSDGACASGYSGSCSYSCTDGTWSLTSNTCTIDTCGNASIDAGEDCDTNGPLLNGQTCASLGFSADPADSNLACTAGTCLFNTSSCAAIACQDGFKEGAEECDDGNSVEKDGCSSICETENPNLEYLIPDYTDTDPNSRSVIQTHKGNYSGLTRNENVTLKRDLGSGNIGNFSYDYYFKTDSCQDAGLANIAYDAGSAAEAVQTGATSVSNSLTVASNDNRVAWCIITREEIGTNRSITSVIRDGQTFTKATGTTTSNVQNKVDFYYFIAPNTGTSNAVVTYSGQVGSTAMACGVHYNVKQQAPEVVFSSVDTLSSFSTLTDSSIAIGGVVAAISTASLVTTDTELHNFANPTEHAMGVSTKIINPAGSSSMGWSVSSGSFAIAGAVFAADSTGTGVFSKHGIMSVSASSHADISAQETAEDGLFILHDCNSASAQATVTLTTVDGGTTNTDSFVSNNIPFEYYGNLNRTGTTLTNSAYSNASRTTLIDAQSVTTTSTAHRYFTPLSSYNDSVTGTVWSGIIGDIDITAEGAPAPPSATKSFIINGMSVNGSSMPDG
jgi:cysteine-rich repeat protein